MIHLHRAEQVIPPVNPFRSTIEPLFLVNSFATEDAPTAAGCKWEAALLWLFFATSKHWEGLCALSFQKLQLLADTICLPSCQKSTLPAAYHTALTGECFNDRPVWRSAAAAAATTLVGMLFLRCRVHLYPWWMKWMEIFISLHCFTHRYFGGLNRTAT